jgi:hypothetical protein
MIKALEISSDLQIFVKVHVIFQLKFMILVLKIVWGNNILNAIFLIVIVGYQIICTILFSNLKFHLILHSHAW